MPQTLTDCRQAHAPVDQFGRVRMTQLVERAAYSGLGTVARPTHLHRLISQRATPAVLLRPEQGSVAVSGLLQVRPELTDRRASSSSTVRRCPPLPSTFRCSSSAVRSRSSKYTPSASETRSPVSKIRRNKSRSRRCAVGIVVRIASTGLRPMDRGRGGSRRTRLIRPSGWMRRGPGGRPSPGSLPKRPVSGAAGWTEPFERGLKAADHLGGDATDGTTIEG